MRRLLTLVMSLLVAALLVGCGSNDDAEYLKDLKAVNSLP